MVDTTLPASVSAVIPTTINTASAIKPIEAAIVQIPDKFQSLPQQIQITATVSAPPTDSLLIVNSPGGPITVALQDSISNPSQSTLQQLQSLFESQRSISLVIQPGTPPEQAWLFLPAGLSAPLPEDLQIHLTSSLPPQVSASPSPAVIVADLRPLTAGSILTAIVLPPPLSESLKALPEPDQSVVASLSKAVV